MFTSGGNGSASSCIPSIYDILGTLAFPLFTIFGIPVKGQLCVKLMVVLVKVKCLLIVDLKIINLFSALVMKILFI